MVEFSEVFSRVIVCISESERRESIVASRRGYGSGASERDW